MKRLARRTCGAALLLFVGSSAGLGGERVPFDGRSGFEPYPAKAAAIPARRAGPALERPSYELPVFAVGAERGDIVADVGCGSGSLSIRLARIVGPDGRVICRDIDSTRIETLRERAQERELANVEATVSLPGDVRIDSDSIDVALLADVYQIVRAGTPPAQDKASFLRSLHRALKPGGVAVCCYVGSGHLLHAPSRLATERGTVADFVAHGFVAGRRWSLLEESGHVFQVLEFQKPRPPTPAEPARESADR